MRATTTSKKECSATFRQRSECRQISVTSDRKMVDEILKEMSRSCELVLRGRAAIIAPERLFRLCCCRSSIRYGASEC